MLCCSHCWLGRLACSAPPASCFMYSRVTAPAVGVDFGHTVAKLVACGDDGVAVSVPCLVDYAAATGWVVGGTAAPSSIRVSSLKRVLGLTLAEAKAVRRPSGEGFPLAGTDASEPCFYVEGAPPFGVVDACALVMAELRSHDTRLQSLVPPSAVVSVPAWYNDARRQATRTAAELAGFKVLRVVNEPTCAAAAFGLFGGDEEGSGAQHAVVVDVGATTLDVALLLVDDEGIVEILSTRHASQGGDDIDRALLRWCADRIQAEHGVDVTPNARAVRRLLSACRRAKEVLSSCTSADIELDALFDGVDFTASVSRAVIDTLATPLYERVALEVKASLAGFVEPAEVHTVALVGGCGRMPGLQAAVSASVAGKPLATGVPPQRAVAHGAALMAHRLSKLRTPPVTSSSRMSSSEVARLVAQAEALRQKDEAERRVHARRVEAKNHLELLLLTVKHALCKPAQPEEPEVEEGGTGDWELRCAELLAAANDHLAWIEGAGRDATIPALMKCEEEVGAQVRSLFCLAQAKWPSTVHGDSSMFTLDAMLRALADVIGSDMSAWPLDGSIVAAIEEVD